MRVNRRAVVSVGGLAALSAVIPVAAKGDAKANEAFARRYIDEVWNKGDFEVFNEMVAEDFQPSEPTDAPGRDACRARIEEARAFFSSLIPDVVYTVESAVASDERAIIRGYIKGSSSNGKAISAIYFNELLIVDGKIKTTWGVQDDRTLMTAL